MKKRTLILVGGILIASSVFAGQGDSWEERAAYQRQWDEHEQSEIRAKDDAYYYDQMRKVREEHLKAQTEAEKELIRERAEAERKLLEERRKLEEASRNTQVQEEREAARIYLITFIDGQKMTGTNYRERGDSSYIDTPEGTLVVKRSLIKFVE